VTRWGHLAGVIAGLSLLASGCGGSQSPSVVSVGTTTTSSSAVGSSGAPPTEAQMQQDSLKFSRCMRANGVPSFPDPVAGGGFLLKTGSGIDPSSPVFEAAQAKCRKLLPGGGPPTPGTETHPSAQALAHMIKVAQCMRRHGISGFPDPTTTVRPLPAGGGVISDIGGVILEFPAALDTQSPAFVRAAAACGFPLHNH
jgi:hypothetical protein